MVKINNNINFQLIRDEAIHHDIQYLRTHLRIDVDIEDHVIESVLNHLKVTTQFQLIPKCQAVCKNGSSCNHVGLAKHQMRYCGVHRKQYAIWSRNQSVSDLPIRHCSKQLGAASAKGAIKICMERCTDIMHEHCDKHHDPVEPRYDVEVLTRYQEDNRKKSLETLEQFEKQEITPDNFQYVKGKCSSCYCSISNNSQQRLCKDCDVLRCCHVSCFTKAVINSNIKGFQYCDLHYQNAIKTVLNHQSTMQGRLRHDLVKTWASKTLEELPIVKRLEKVRSLLGYLKTRIANYQKFACDGIVGSSMIDNMADNYDRDRDAVKALYRLESVFVKELGNDDDESTMTETMINKIFRWPNWAALYKEKKRKRHFDPAVEARINEEEVDPQCSTYQTKLRSRLNALRSTYDDDSDDDDSDEDSDSDDDEL